MTFAQVENLLLQLRRRMTTCVGFDCIGEITVNKPDDHHGELSFLRLVIWAYAVQQEKGRVVLRFVDGLPAVAPRKAVLRHVGFLRTWVAHNLSLDQAGDQKTLRQAEAWLLEACSSGSPQTDAQWRACSNRLREELASSIDAAIFACDFLATDSDGTRLIDDLKRRLERDWPAHAFDRFVDNACRRLGYPEIEVSKFRARHLDAWRKVVESAKDGEIEPLLQRRIEADLIALMGQALPFASQDLGSMLRGVAPAALASAMLVVMKTAQAATHGPAHYTGELLQALNPERTGGDARP